VTFRAGSIHSRCFACESYDFARDLISSTGAAGFVLDPHGRAAGAARPAAVTQNPGHAGRPGAHPRGRVWRPRRHASALITGKRDDRRGQRRHVHLEPAVLSIR
jgi:hypothetical protein